MGSSQQLAFLPRVIRVKDAHRYLGMDKTTFAREIRPYLTLIKITNKSRGFERVDIDHAFDVYICGRCCPPKKPLPIGDNICESKQVSTLTPQVTAGSSTKKLKENAFANALSTAKSSAKKRNAD